MAGLMTDKEQQRLDDIREIFRKNNKHGGMAKDDKVFAQLLEFNGNLEGIIRAIKGN
ncbi:hypothetical protein ACR78F_02440 [Sphingobacterium spiritivorum]|uniref:hypothetical protein n=1 Tax=Sphingobacterium spiritivorum TaxID=258 RepID=UPI003DA3C986